MNQLHHAHSILEVKSPSEDQRIITGMATTPETDRAGDIVDPLGAQFAAEVPLLWQHRHDYPVGFAKFEKATKKGIQFTAKIVSVEEDGLLKQTVEMAWQAVKAKLVRGVSIGFRSIEHSYIDGGGIRFTKIEIYELSLVTIPANASATILSVKAMDNGRRSQYGVRLVSPIAEVTDLRGAVKLLG